MMNRQLFLMSELFVGIVFVCCGWSLSYMPCAARGDDSKIAEVEMPQDKIKSDSSLELSPVEKDRWLIVLCSLSGDEEHEKRLTQSIQQISQSIRPVFGVESEHFQVLLSSKSMLNAVPGAKPCNRTTLEELTIELQNVLSAESEFIFFVLGHAHLDGRSSQFNIAGPDIDQNEYAGLFEKLSNTRQIHWIGTPISGYWIKALSKANRVIMTATVADLEITATEMPYALGDILAGTASHSKLADIDGDGSVTMLDLYLAVNIEVHGRFLAEEFVPTEHALLDDNGDGRGSALQEPFLKKDTLSDDEDKVQTTSISKQVPLDGDLAKAIKLYLKTPLR